MALHRARTSKTNGHITVRPREITKLEGKELFERKVRKATGLSTEAFIENWKTVNCLTLLRMLASPS